MTPNITSHTTQRLAGPRSGIASALVVAGTTSALILTLAAIPALRPLGNGQLDTLLSAPFLSTLAWLLATALAGTALALAAASVHVGVLTMPRARWITAGIDWLAGLTLMLPVGVLGAAMAWGSGEAFGLVAAAFLVGLPHASRQLRAALAPAEVAALATARNLGVGPLTLAVLAGQVLGPGLRRAAGLVLARAIAECGMACLLLALAAQAGMAVPASQASVEAAISGSILLALALTIMLASWPALSIWLPGPFIAIVSVAALAALLAGAALLMAAIVTGGIAPAAVPAAVVPPGLRLLSVGLLAAAGMALPAALLAGMVLALRRLAEAADSLPELERTAWSAELAALALGVPPAVAAARLTLPGLLRADPVMIATMAMRGMAEFLLALHVFTLLAATAGMPWALAGGLHDALLNDLPLLLAAALLFIALGAGRRLGWRPAGGVRTGEPYRT